MLNQKIKKILSKNLSLILGFLIPLVIMALYAVYRNMAPFGNNTILTVDLGQQYIDFFAYFRRAILQHPSSIFYSFSNGLGNEMIGTWAYYLMSPLNLILLFFSNDNLSIGVLFLLLIKIGLSGFTFSVLIKKLKLTKSWLISSSFATAYALNGWMVANNLNIIWLDAMILLPLIVLGLSQLLKNKHSALFIISYTAMLIINCYMAYMITIFIILLTIYYLAVNAKSIKEAATKLLRLLINGIISVGLAAFILFPVFYSLLNSKGQGFSSKLNFKFEYPILDIVTKLTPGSFNFDQMPNGLPNIFVSSMILMLFLLFFINRTFSKRLRFATFIMTIFLILSACFEPLNLFWHAFQFPIWYPYRFSFVICFWLIMVALTSLNHIRSINLTQKGLWIMIIILLAMIGYTCLRIPKYNYLKWYTVTIEGLMILASLIVLITPFRKEKWFNAGIFLLVIFGIAANLFLSLDNISYLSNVEYRGYVTKLNQVTTNLHAKSSNQLFRINKDFSRTKNDPFNFGFNGASLFSSVMNPQMSNLIGNLGQPNGDGVIEYSSGTMVSDALLSMNYHIARPLTASVDVPGIREFPERYDQAAYKYQNNVAGFSLYKNQYALPMLFSASKQAITSQATSADPIQYQSELWSNLTGNQSVRRNLFSNRNFDNVKYNNVTKHNQLTGTIFNKVNPLKPASLELEFKPQTNNSYYLTLGTEMQNSKCDLFVNGNQLSLSPESNSIKVINIANQSKDKVVDVKIQFKKSSLWLQNFTLYQLNNSLFKQTDRQLQAGSIKVTSPNSRRVNAIIDTNNSKSVVASSIPYSKGWHAKVNGKNHPLTKWDNYFIAIKTGKGKQNIQLSYWPPFLNLGILVSVLTLLILLVQTRFKKLRK
ncbi:YfhO family protein [Fructilactobacillus fructivorans]|uniref:YfhO family protein n=1 Tax=Fructilactobacillus fructivorans TaxID=1614 RepID=UPI000705661A|nr:YfhO family protein [Fructilactobacillus fructivorans]